VLQDVAYGAALEERIEAVVPVRQRPGAVDPVHDVGEIVFRGAAVGEHPQDASDTVAEAAQAQSAVGQRNPHVPSPFGAHPHGRTEGEDNRGVARST